MINVFIPLVFSILLQEKGYDVNEAVKTLLPITPPISPKSKTPKSKQSAIFNSKKIQKLRQEYQVTAKKIDMKPINENGVKGSAREAKLKARADSSRKLGTLQINR